MRAMPSRHIRLVTPVDVQQIVGLYHQGRENRVLPHGAILAMVLAEIHVRPWKVGEHSFLNHASAVTTPNFKANDVLQRMQRNELAART